MSPFEMVPLIEGFGAGEIVMNSIDNDGVMKGYDLELARRVKQMAHVPVTVLGGAGSLKDIGDLVPGTDLQGADFCQGTMRYRCFGETGITLYFL